MEQGDAALHAEARSPGVSWIEIPDAADGLIERLVRVPEDNRIRLLALHALGEQHRGRVRLHDVLQEKFVASQFEDFDFLQRQHQIRVSENRRDGRDFFELGEN